LSNVFLYFFVAESTADKGNKLIDKANQRVISSHLLWVTIVCSIYDLIVGFS